jgi:hypothetical protein
VRLVRGILLKHLASYIAYAEVRSLYSGVLLLYEEVRALIPGSAA